jgi:hypothetical protein
MLALEAGGGGSAAFTAVRVAELADALGPLRSSSPRRELVACGALLAARFDVDVSGRIATLRADTVLREGRGAPLVLGAIAVTAAREAGIALGLLAGPRGRFAVAHAMLAKPLVLDLGEGFALRDIAGAEPSFRWLCAHAAAQRVAQGARRARRDGERAARTRRRWAAATSAS